MRKRIVKRVLRVGIRLAPLCPATFVFAVLACPASALPQGRAWTSTETLFIPGSYLTAPRLEAPAGGVVLYAGGAQGPAGEAFGFQWADSTWQLQWLLGDGTSYLWPVLEPTDQRSLVWKGGDPDNDGKLFLSSIGANGPVPPDTVASVDSRTAFYAATLGLSHRWVIASDAGLDLRLFSSPATGIWQEVQAPDRGNRGVSAISVDDTTALFAWSSDDNGLKWGTLHGATFDISPIPLANGLSGAPRFYSGQFGLKLGWATKGPNVLVRSMGPAMTWGATDTIKCAYSDQQVPDQHYSDAFDISRNSQGYPAIAWGAFDGAQGVDVICASMPTDSGWTTAEEISNSSEGLLPTVARDENGDVWVAFMRYSNGVFWAHTYTRATASDPEVIKYGNKRLVLWTLSEPAPGSYWTVLRAQSGSGYEEVARVRAGSGLEMSWTDSTPPISAHFYRVRREAVDIRYRLETGATVDADSGLARLGFSLSILGGNPVRDALRCVITNSNDGPVTLTLHDALGRQLLSRTVHIVRTQPQVLELELRSTLTPSGVYFVAASTPSGSRTEPVKIVFLR